MWVEYNPNPVGRRAGDCAIRAVAKALDVSWETAYAMLAANGYAMGDLMNADYVWGATLRQHGFKRKALPNDCPDCYTAADFAEEHPKGVYVLAFGNHVATIVDGSIFDSWDSSGLVPQYVWYREGDDGTI